MRRQTKIEVEVKDKDIGENLFLVSKRLVMNYPHSLLA